MSEVASMLAVIPGQTGTTSTGFDSGTVTVNIITREIILVLEEISQFRYPQKIKFQRGIINRSMYVIGMSHVEVINEVESDHSFISLPYLCGLNCVNFDIDSRESANEE